MARRTIDEVASPETAAKVWDDYLRRFGPAAYVTIRYVHASEPPGLSVGRESEDHGTR